LAESGDNSQERELEPTERRIARAREQGQLPQSRDLTTLIAMITLTIFLVGIGPLLVKQLVLMTQAILQFSEPAKLIDDLQTWLGGSLLMVIVLVTLIFIPLWIIGVLAPLSLVNFRAYFAPQFKLERLDVIAGIGRMFSLDSLSELLKGLIKTTLMLGVGFGYLFGLFSYIRSIVHQDFDAALLQTFSFILNGVALLLLPLLLIAVGDSWLQWFKFRKQIRMSPEEMKQEGKESEGSPETKQRQRQLQRQMSLSRMMAAIERADVVLANPEHYSVALRYDMEKMSAPIVVAKGADQMALRIQEVAKDFDVPIARIPPLARYLYSQLEIGDSIPLPLFEAIAQILAWAYDTKESGSPGEIPQVDFTPTQLNPGKPLLL
jgi:flagellar biosynthetic protein FlhB